MVTQPLTPALSCSLFAILTTATLGSHEIYTHPIANAFLITLAGKGESNTTLSQLESFHQNANSLSYSIRHDFSSSGLFSGLSIQVADHISPEDAFAQLQIIPGLNSVSKVYDVALRAEAISNINPLLSDLNPPAIPTSFGSSAILNGALEMGGVNKLHSLGVKGKGIKIGVIDTGVDHRHPALGGGFGPGHKIAGGYSFVLDNGTLSNSPDPLSTCFGGGHGTHVSGILGMSPVFGSFDITGVAPEASIYMYRVFDCFGHAGSDTIAAAMTRASFSGAVDALAGMVEQTIDLGVGVIVAVASDAIGADNSSELYTAEYPSTESKAIGVGAITNANFPTIYFAEDSAGATLQYASVSALGVDLDVFFIDNGCNQGSWTKAIAAIPNITSTIIAFPITLECKATFVSWNPASQDPVYILGYTSAVDDPYLAEYNIPSRTFFGNATYINVNIADGIALESNYVSSGGFGRFKLYFTNETLTSTPQNSGGMMDYYSSFGPTWHDFMLKPQLSAPGGGILSTWPLGQNRGYSILSGTSMAAPYLAGCYALVKSQFPKATPDEIKVKLQNTARPVAWVYDQTILSSTAQQGAGLVNVYDAVMAKTSISPSQLTISDNNRTVYGTANITIENESGSTLTYSLSHDGAGYMDYYLEYQEISQQANYGSANFPTPTISLRAGQSTNVAFSISPPIDVTPSSLPIFGGFVKIASSAGEKYSVPYIGPPYSLYNTNYLLSLTPETGGRLPSMYAQNSSGIIYNTGFLEINSSTAFGGSVPTLQWTTHLRVDLLPANTNITAHYYGTDNATIAPVYKPSAFAPNETLLGHPSFGNLVNRTGFSWPGNYGPSGSETTVTASTGVRWSVGPGDYRWFASVLRWGGAEERFEDWDTWLGPIIRFV